MTYILTPHFIHTKINAASKIKNVQVVDAAQPRSDAIEVESDDGEKHFESLVSAVFDSDVLAATPTKRFAIRTKTSPEQCKAGSEVAQHEIDLLVAETVGPAPRPSQYKEMQKVLKKPAGKKQAKKKRKSGRRKREYSNAYHAEVARGMQLGLAKPEVAKHARLVARVHCANLFA